MPTTIGDMNEVEGMAKARIVTCSSCDKRLTFNPNDIEYLLKHSVAFNCKFCNMVLDVSNSEESPNVTFCRSQ